jgi:hypothetical protein
MDSGAGDPGGADGANTAPPPNPPPRCSGATSPVDGEVENSELCADATPGMISASMSMIAGAACLAAARTCDMLICNFPGTRLMTRAFSAQIAAISSH